MGQGNNGFMELEKVKEKKKNNNFLFHSSTLRLVSLFWFLIVRPLNIECGHLEGLLLKHTYVYSIFGVLNRIIKEFRSFVRD